MKKILTASSLFFALPLIAFAQTPAGTTLTQIVGEIGGIVDMLVPILLALALVVFFWGLIRYVFSKGGKGVDSARKLMIWGLVALFVMVSVWGIIRLAQATLGINQVNTITAPSVE